MVLVAHGSRDARAAAATRALARSVAAARPGLDVRAAYLEHTAPSLDTALGAVSAGGHRAAAVVPLLLTAAYHHTVDIPSVLDRLRAGGVPLAARRAPVLGPAPGGTADPALVAALCLRLAETGKPYDALVLAAAGTRDASARSCVAAVATALGERLGMPCVPAYASAAAPGPGAAVAGLRARGARRVAVASYFLAPGLLHDRALASARAAGAVAASAPLGDAPELAALVLARADAAVPLAPAG
ncbi:CbiX/SirB N-terminal domain-containing protein [Sphaerisporangium sp. TRM90804]|uniref:sirohydrochlorin chelatase n=1 Tax=Sphaerisporangium sp. TRM90804 TaxID=3031113 RepID=UPI00244AEE7C|nr:CbiX/SirB N-terminal domain-containing protein [Sphaerisporangium sp. TRM90804]MDH2428352.1 CbiX/SirB N-terminal domain-containing protein [Sphaerisporangium sp. TRM90804]